MSVAFRRESDEEHKEPRFEIPIPAGPNLVTAHGLEHIRSRIAVLEAVIASGKDERLIQEAQRDLRYWRTRHATARRAPLASGDEVAFGTRVTFSLDGSERSLAIVGHDEADPGAGTISFAAPLARALLGAELGEVIDFAGGSENIEVLGIEVLPSGAD